MTDAQESMVKAKLAEIADAIPECRGAVFAISTGNDGEEGDVTVFKSAGSKEMVNLFTNITAQVAIAIAAETTPGNAVELFRRYGNDAKLVLAYGFLTTVRAALSKDIAATMRKQLDKELEEVIGGGNQVS